MRVHAAILPCLALALVVASPAVALAQADAHGHDHAHAAVPASDLPAGSFAADAVLHGHMEQLTKDVQALDHYAHDRLDQEQAVLLAKRVVERVHAIIEECTLPPDADHALHGIIGPLLVNAQALASDPARTDAIPPMEGAVAEYHRLFTPTP